MKSAALEKLEEHLEEWAEWFSHGCRYVQGYPTKSIEGRLIEEGGVLIKSTAPSYPRENQRAEEIETYVCELNEQSPELADVLRVNYFCLGTVEVKAKIVKLSVTQFRVYVGMAKQWVVGRMS